MMMMMMMMKGVSSSFYSSFCRHKAANPIFSSSPKSSLSKLLRYSSSSSDSSSSEFPPIPKSRSENTYIDSVWGHEVKIHDPISDPYFEDIWYVTSDEEVLEAYGWTAGDESILPKGLPRECRNMCPVTFEEPPPRRMDFATFRKISEEQEKLIPYHKENYVPEKKEQTKT